MITYDIKKIAIIGKIFQKAIYKSPKLWYNSSRNGKSEAGMDYIARIKKIKSEKKITNDKLAELTGIPLGTLSKILAGISDSPKLSNMVAIADALGCSLNYLLTGEPENNNNYTLSSEEMSIIDAFRKLDPHGKDLTRIVVEKELERVSSGDLREAPTRKEKYSGAKILSRIDTRITPSSDVKKRMISLYNLPVSAGPGVYLDDTASEEIKIPDNEKTANADFALRISGNSMEPKYHDGDILLVEDSDYVEVGELGIFILDGNGYFKKYGGDRLISINPEYKDILLKDYAETVCCGRVTGKLKKR